MNNFLAKKVMRNEELKFAGFEREENPDEEARRELEAEGWQYVGREVTHMTPFNPETGRFDPMEVKTAGEIKQEYLDKYGKHGFGEVRLVRPIFLKTKLAG